MEMLRSAADAARSTADARANGRNGRGGSPRSLAELLSLSQRMPVKSDEEIQRDEAEREERLRRSRVAEFWATCNVPRKYRGIPRDPVWRSIPEDARESYRVAFAQLLTLESKRGGAIVAMVGERGAGKTWMACCLVKRFCAAARRAAYVNAQTFFADLRRTYGDRGIGTEHEVLARYRSPELLVLDGVEEKSETSASQQSMLTWLLCSRLDDEKLSVVISNDDGSSLQDRIGRSLTDRLKDGGGIIRCTWESLRGRVADSNEN